MELQDFLQYCSTLSLCMACGAFLEDFVTECEDCSVDPYAPWIDITLPNRPPMTRCTFCFAVLEIGADTCDGCNHKLNERYWDEFTAMWIVEAPYEPKPILWLCCGEEMPVGCACVMPMPVTVLEYLREFDDAEVPEVYSSDGACFECEFQFTELCIPLLRMLTLARESYLDEELFVPYKNEYCKDFRGRNEPTQRHEAGKSGYL